jgi:hypothetical protein
MRAILALCILLIGGCTDVQTSATVYSSGPGVYNPLFGPLLENVRPLDPCALVKDPTEYEASVRVEERYEHGRHNNEVTMSRNCRR